MECDAGSKSRRAFGVAIFDECGMGNIQPFYDEQKRSAEDEAVAAIKASILRAERMGGGFAPWEQTSLGAAFRLLSKGFYRNAVVAAQKALLPRSERRGPPVAHEDPEWDELMKAFERKYS
jgi:hypothetical protein